MIDFFYSCCVGLLFELMLVLVFGYTLGVTTGVGVGITTGHGYFYFNPDILTLKVSYF